ncbi:hypothetical protein [Rhodopila sp.]|uniref:hypothetical protein n=1 Tax=Rhodopila sp. TaxID=2480087 RepID=UPI003D0D87DA
MPTTTQSFAHVANRLVRQALEADPITLNPKLIRALAHDALIHAEIDLGDPDVHNAGQRMEIAEEAVSEADPVRAHGIVQRFWSI